VLNKMFTLLLCFMGTVRLTDRSKKTAIFEEKLLISPKGEL